MQDREGNLTVKAYLVFENHTFKPKLHGLLLEYPNLRDSQTLKTILLSKFHNDDRVSIE